MPLAFNSQVYAPAPDARFSYYPHRVHHTPDQLNPWNPYHRIRYNPSLYSSDAYWSNGYDSHFTSHFERPPRERFSPVQRAQNPFVIELSSSDEEPSQAPEEERGFRVRTKRRRCGDCDSPALNSERNRHESGKIMAKIGCRQHGSAERNDDQSDALNLTSRPINLSNHVNRNGETDATVSLLSPSETDESKPNVDELNRSIKVESNPSPPVINVKREIKTEENEDARSSPQIAAHNIKTE